MSRIFFALLLTPVILPAGQWLRINSTNFELFTTAGEKKGREAILYFEQVRGLFDKLAKSGGQTTAPVRIIAFQSDKEYKPYRLNDFASAYYLGSRERDYIVMKDIAPERYPLAMHEYTHLVVKHSGLSLPAWLDEGLADVFSTLKPSGDQVRLGDVLPGRIRELQTGKWLDIETLIAVDRKSPLYNERRKAGMFYAQSWALTHMLYLSTGYWEKFSQFLSLIKPGASQVAVFREVYRKSLSQVQQDLERYLQGTRLNTGFADVKLEESAGAPDVRAATPLESGLALADLLAVTRKRKDAKTAYERLAREYPDSPDVALAMARLAWMSSDHMEMQRHFARAIELGTTNAKVYFDYAMMLREDGGRDEETAVLLRKAITLQPDLEQAHYVLGFDALTASRFEEAVSHLSRVASVERDRKFSYFRALAYANFRLGRREEAKKNAESAVQFATDPKEAELARELLDYVTHHPAAAVR